MGVCGRNGSGCVGHFESTNTLYHTWPINTSIINISTYDVLAHLTSFHQGTEATMSVEIKIYSVLTSYYGASANGRKNGGCYTLYREVFIQNTGNTLHCHYLPGLGGHSAPS